MTEEAIRFVVAIELAGQVQRVSLDSTFEEIEHLTFDELLQRVAAPLLAAAVQKIGVAMRARYE